MLPFISIIVLVLLINIDKLVSLLLVKKIKKYNFTVDNYDEEWYNGVNDDEISSSSTIVHILDGDKFDAH